MKKVSALVLVLCLLVSLMSTAALAEEKKTIVIGATPSPHQEILEEIIDDMAALGYELKIVTFTEYPMPNPALAKGDLDANYFQHIPYLNQYNAKESEADQLVAVIPVHYEPYCIYAGRTASLEELPEGAIVAVTDDPANETRALLLLQEAGIITLPEGTTVDDSVTALDVVENPLNVHILEMAASELAAALVDVDIAVINGNFALDYNLSPAEDSIFMEPLGSVLADTYTNYVVVRPEDAESEWVEALRSCLQSKKIYDFILSKEDYKGGVIPAFTVDAE